MLSYKKKIAKNAALLYARKGFSIFIGLYTARLLLQNLGYDDYGLYSVVGSVVIMFNALRYIFAEAIQRFINIAKGEENPSKINEIFSIGIDIHVALSILFIIIVEVAGLFILPTLNTGDSPKWIVNIIFQASLFSAIVTLMTVPYDALIIAHERFKVYAFFSIIDVVLRLCLAASLVLFSDIRVVWYSIITFLILLFIRFINATYCRFAFQDVARYKYTRNRELTLEIAKFAGWNFVGNIGYWLTFSGIDLILNHFGGLVINASKSIANQVFYNFQQFVADLNTSFRPRSMMVYSQNRINEFYSLLLLNTKTNFYICSILCYSFISFAPEILKLWLSSVPSEAPIFCQCILFYTMVRCLRGPMDIYYKTIGKLRVYQIAECFITVLNIPLSIIALYLKYPLYSVFIIMAFLETINYITIIFIASLRYDFNYILLVKSVIPRIILCACVGGFLTVYTVNHKALSIIGLLTEMLGYVVLVAVIGFVIIFTANEQRHLVNMVINKKGK